MTARPAPAPTPAPVSALEAAAFRPMLTPGRWFWPIFAALGLVVLAAVGAFAYQYAEGLWVAGYSDPAFFGIYEANLVAFIGVSYGGAVVSAVLRLTHARWGAPLSRMAEAMAVVSLVVGGSFAIVHLGRPERVWTIFTSPNFSSPIVWDFMAITTYLLATSLFLYLPLIPDLARARDRVGPPAPRGLRRRIYAALALRWHDLPDQRRRLSWAVTILAILVIPLAVSVHSVLAYTFSMTTRPGWHSTIFGPYFVVGALYSGVGLVILVIAAFRRAYRLDAFIQPRHLLNLSWLMTALGLVYLYLTFSETLTGAYTSTRDELPVVTALLEGPFAPAFWSFLVLGVIAPIVLVALPVRRHVGILVLAAALAVGGMWLKRLLITLPSATLPLVDDAAPWGSPVFTWVATLITLGATAAIPLGLMIVFRFVPVLAIDECEQAAAEDPARIPVAPQAVPEGVAG